MKMKKILFILFISTLLVGCNGWLDVNKDPNNPQDVPMSLLLPSVELNATYVLAPGSGSLGTGLGEDLGVYTHQLSTREAANVYGADGSEYYLRNAWSGMYISTLQNLDIIITKSGESNAPYYEGIAKVIKAYMYSQFVDVFGDVPFTEANKKADGIVYPKFDNGVDIYPALITMLDDAIAKLKTTATVTVPKTDDLIFGGDVTKWIKTANTIKLKLYTQTYNQKGADKAAIGAKIKAIFDNLATTPLIAATADGFMFPFVSQRTPDNRHPAYGGTYEATQKTTNISPWFFEILKGINPVFSGIVDPRIPYYFYNQLKPSQTGKDGNKFEYRVGGFASIYFGSTGPDNGAAQDKSQTVYGIYPCGGRYDQGDALTVDKSSGTGAAPYRFLTYADRLFLEAELLQAGIITTTPDGNDAKTVLNAAMVEAFRLVDYVAAKANGSQTIPVLTGATKTNTYITSILSLFDAGDANKKMEIIMTQKWISSFGSFVDQYTDYRRTGYPKMFDPNDATMAPSGFVTPPAGGDPDRTLPPVKVSCSLAYPRSLAWSIDEINVNKNAPKQKTDPSTYYVFWDPKKN